MSHRDPGQADPPPPPWRARHRAQAAGDDGDHGDGQPAVPLAAQRPDGALADGLPAVEPARSRGRHARTGPDDEPAAATAGTLDLRAPSELQPALIAPDAAGPATPTPAGFEPAGEDWPAAGDPAGGWRLPREPGDPDRRPVADRIDVDARAAASARTAEEPAERVATGRAGRNLPAAIGIGLALGAVVLASLLWWKPAFFGVIVLAIAVGTWEMVRAVRGSGARPPLVPLLLAGPVMVGLSWYGGPAALPYGLVGAATAVLVWRLADGPVNYHRDVTAALFVMVYVPFLGSFAAALTSPDDGRLRVLATLIGVVLSDTGGYASGVFLGRHAMAPSVSPKKSWEGFAGSLLAAGVGGAVLLYHLFDVAWWYGAAFGLAVAGAAVLGDLAESLLKRDLGIKDMSSLLPGHGGLMDRLDSILFAVPTGYVVLTLVAPVG